MTETIRINKRIKDLGLASRREADTLIEAGLVLVNGKKATIGQSVTETDEIKITKKDRGYVYLAFYKPKGVMSHSPQYGEQEIKDFIRDFDKLGLTIIGRLDKHSEGLMLVTNDKRLVEKVLDPKFEHEREYEVHTQERVSNNMTKLFAKGFTVRGRFQAKPAVVDVLGPYQFNITLTEGKKHQIRLMAGELHYTVATLKRIRIMNIKLGRLSPGKSRELTETEKRSLLRSLDLKSL